MESGLYDTLQYPFNHLATDREVRLVRRCAERGVGFVAMKALSGGLVTDARAPFVYLSEFENVLPIWGFQHMWELEQLLKLSENPPKNDPEIQAVIEKDRAELVGAFCRSCGYCLPCPKRKRTIPSSPRSWLLWRKSTSPTPSAPSIARTLPPRAWPSTCPPSPAS